MKKFIHYGFLTFLSLFFLTIGFYLWASSPNLRPDDYSSIYTNSESISVNTNQEFSILTYNIGYLSGMTNNLPVDKPRSLFDQNSELVIRNLRRLNPDFIALQEIDYDSDRSFNIDQHQMIEELGYPYSGKTINWDKRYVPFPYFPVSMQFGKIVSGQSVLSKYPILEQQRIELERNNSNPFYYDSFYLDRLAQVVKISVQGRNLILINAHLEAFDQETRIRQMEKLRSLYGSFCKIGPTIMLGDFNSDMQYENAGIMLLTEMVNTGNAAFSQSSYDNTFDSREPVERLDYIFYNTEFIEELSSEVVKGFKEASDHLPVLLKFKFKDKKYGTAQQSTP